MSDTGAMPLVEVRALGLDLGGVRALQQIHLSLQRGERLALVGANGSGKSTLLRVLHGLLMPTTGQVLRDGAARQALLFQRPWMLRTHVLNNLLLGLWLAGVRGAQARERAHHALAQVGLTELAHRPARTLSGGQQQRLALARALALQPDVLLLDEPTASLDPHAKREVEELMERFALQPGAGGQPVAMVFASHNLGQVKRLASRVVYLEGGRLLADLPVRDFFDAEVLQRSYPQAHVFVKGELG
jgi:tungstate transport system ATP-binding protein